MKISLIPNNLKDPENVKLNEVINILKELDFEYYVCKNFTESLDNKFIYTNPDDIPADTDLVVTLGGDGTILQAARDLRGYNFPIAGINLGTLGYLAETEFNQVRDMFKSVKNGNYIFEERMLIAAFDEKNDKEHSKAISQALNDIVIKASNPFDTVAVNLYVNNKFVTKYYADGLIIATPTGSTAYNLSAGGPIIEPTTKMMIVTPICSFALGLGSIVFGGQDEIVVEMCNSRKGEKIEGEIIFDGVTKFKFNTGDKLYIKRSEYNAKFVKFTETSFLEILREKMKK